MRKPGNSSLTLGVICSCLIVIMPFAETNAATIRVPSEQPTIQAGVDAATEGDTVLVAPGTYTGPGNNNIWLDHKRVAIKSESGPSATIINCQGIGGGFELYGRISGETVIEGFTIENGDAGIRDCGGALWSMSTSVRVVECIFANNSATVGGAICASGDVYNISVSLERCTFLGNTAEITGGLFYCMDVDLIVDHSVLYNNSTLGGGDLIYLDPYETCTIALQCCDLYANTPLDWALDFVDQYGVNDNFSAPPMFCDEQAGLYGLHMLSPLRPEVSPCGELIGALDVSCTDCYDVDADGLCAVDDNCPVNANSNQLDSDQDGIGDACEDMDGDRLLDADDNCPAIPNPDQTDQDNDGTGDLCDDDLDGDGFLNEQDNCPWHSNPSQEDHNSDGVGDACCCVGQIGDANMSGDPEPTIGDITTMIDGLFITGYWSVIACPQEADLNRSGGCNPTTEDITIGDVTILIAYLFISSGTLPQCLQCP